MNGDWFVYDPDPMPDWYPAGGPILVGPFQSEQEAETHANISHEDDGSGNTVVLQAVKP
jgi:hypothetical protein